MRVCPSCYAQESDTAEFCGLCGSKLFHVKTGTTSLQGIVLNDKYVVQKLIARGGMGEVYLAEHKGLQQRVAVKVLSKRFNTDATVVMRFFNEAQTYGRVKHPNAVNIHDFGQLEDGMLYMIMEYVDGETLTEHLKRHGPLPLKRVLQIGIQLADVLFAAHSQDVVHRDLKPDNVMLIESSPGRFQVKVLDFGIAKILGESDVSQLTEAGMVFGTPEFMSPEQALGLEDVDHRADIYAFGMLLYYMTTGRLPFEGSNKMAILNRQVNEIPKRPSEIAPHIELDPDLEAVMLTCIRKNRAERFTDQEKVLADLELIAAGQRPATARPEDFKSTTGNLGHIDLSGEPGVTRRSEGLVVLSDQDATRAGDPLEAMFARASSVAVTAVSEAVSEDGPGPHSDITRVAGAVDSGVDVNVDFDEPSRLQVVVDDEDSLRSTQPYADPVSRSDVNLPNIGNSEWELAGPPTTDSPIIVTPPRRPDPPSDEMELTGVRESPSTNGEMEFGDARPADDGFSLGGDDNDDGEFSLGVGMALEHGDMPSGYSDRSRGGSGGLIGALVFVALVLAGVAVWFFVIRDSGTTPEEEPGPRAVSTDLSDEAPDSDISEQPEVVADQPTEPPAMFSAELRRHALSRLMVTLADEKVREADFKAGMALLDHGRKHGGDMPEVYVKRYTELETQATNAELILRDAKKAARRMRCDEVQAKIPVIEPISPGAAAALGEMYAKCKRSLEAPPTTLD